MEEQLKEGFVTSSCGIRVGVAGEYVSENGNIKTLKNISSVNIRIPHRVENCSVPLLKFIVEKTLKNTLIISPCGAGKTTIIRDIAEQLSSAAGMNILIVDERGEIYPPIENEGEGAHIDCVSFADKNFAFRNGVRALSPDVIITDELMNERDVECVSEAVLSGIKVVATCHGGSIDDIKKKECFHRALADGIFERFAILSSNGGKGTLVNVLDGNFNVLI